MKKYIIKFETEITIDELDWMIQIGSEDLGNLEYELDEVFEEKE